MIIETAVWIAAGGFFGAIARYAAVMLCSRLWKTRFPWGTVFVNVTGSFMLGWLTGSGVMETYALMMGTGFLGAYTTFSTFKVESVQLLRNAHKRAFIMYIGVMYSAGIVMALFGFALGS